MQRFILSAFTVLLAASTVAPNAVAAPKGESGFNLQTVRLREFDARNKSDFKLQTLRLREFDARNKSEEDEKPYYPYGQAPEASEWTNPQDVTAEQENTTNTGSTAPEATEVAEEDTQSLSVTERRQQSLDRS